MFIEHALMTADVAIAFVTEARKHPGHHIGEWEPDWQAAERLRSRTVIPDGHFVYATPEWEIYAFVEVDLGTERRAGSPRRSRRTSRRIGAGAGGRNFRPGRSS